MTPGTVLDGEKEFWVYPPEVNSNQDYAWWDAMVMFAVVLPDLQRLFILALWERS